MTLPEPDLQWTPPRHRNQLNCRQGTWPLALEPWDCRYYERRSASRCRSPRRPRHRGLGWPWGWGERGTPRRISCSCSCSSGRGRTSPRCCSWRYSAGCAWRACSCSDTLTPVTCGTPTSHPHLCIIIFIRKYLTLLDISWMLLVTILLMPARMRTQCQTQRMANTLSTIQVMMQVMTVRLTLSLIMLSERMQSAPLVSWPPPLPYLW